MVCLWITEPKTSRLLKKDRRLTLGIGDNREHCFYVPVGFQLIRVYLNNGFELEELVRECCIVNPSHLPVLTPPLSFRCQIIKRQRYCSAFGLGTYLCVQFDFLVFTHEFIATFRKVPIHENDKMDSYDGKQAFLSNWLISQYFAECLVISLWQSESCPNYMHHEGDTKVTHCTKECGYGNSMAFQTLR